MAKLVCIDSLGKLTGYVEESCTGGLHLFRGQRRHDLPLVPTLGRTGARAWKIPHWEKKMLEELKRRSPPYLAPDSAPQDDWHWLALAQHHKMATRLLDWTDNPLAALWFAVEKEPARDKLGELVPGVVWTFRVFDDDVVSDTSSGSPFSGKRTQVFRPQHIAKSIVAQGGWFTAHKLVEGEGFIALERNRIYRGALRRLKVPPEHFEKLRYQLDLFGVNAASLFPDLTGLCESLNAKHLPALRPDIRRTRTE